MSHKILLIIKKLASSPARTIHCVAGLFLVGVWLSPLCSIDLIILSGLVVSALMMIWILNNHWYGRLFFGIAALCCGIIRYDLAQQAMSADPLLQYHGTSPNITAVIAADPEVGIDKQRVVLGITHVDDAAVSSLALTTFGLYPRYHYGDVLSGTCQLIAPEPIEDFAYDHYLALSGIHTLCRQPRFKVVARDQGNVLYTALYWIKDKAQETIYRALPEPEASLLFAVNFGPRGGIPDALYAAFRTTGTTHLIAISGSNMTIIVALLSSIASAMYISRRKTFWIISVFLLSYVVMIGLSASAVRAALMSWLVLLAQKVGRLPQSGAGLLLVAALMVLQNPLILRDDVGFQLSFLAVLGLLYISPHLERPLSWVPGFAGIREALQMTLAAQSTTLPLLIFTFGTISVIAPVANLLVVPVFSYVVIISLPLIGAAALFPTMGSWLLLPLMILLRYQIIAVSWFGQFSWSLIHV